MTVRTPDNWFVGNTDGSEFVAKNIGPFALPASSFEFVCPHCQKTTKVESFREIIYLQMTLSGYGNPKDREVYIPHTFCQNGECREYISLLFRAPDTLAFNMNSYTHFIIPPK